MCAAQLCSDDLHGANASTCIIFFYIFFKKNQVDTTRVSNCLDPYQDKYHIGVGCICASSDFCSLLITFANSLDPDQDQYNQDQQ